MSTNDALAATKRAIVDALKRRAQTGPELAERFGVTTEAIRQHLGDLDERGLVTSAPRPVAGPGRPPVEWSLTELAAELFPDRHADLTVSLIDSLRQAIGEDGLDAVIAARTAEQVEQYQSALAGAEDPVDALAAIRSDEGYMAEVVEASDGRGRLLVEHHCPICDAARVCQGLCRAELDLFQTVLGTRVQVTREQHLMAGDARCVYRVEPTGG